MFEQVSVPHSTRWSLSAFIKTRLLGLFPLYYAALLLAVPREILL